ncbi:S41 family peptidase [Ectothiorhodospiraceae bacterium WFHF3C12]|nr:S41 family peptidase [Ectothiorhodospiraceae bacterium WFHF3C12]
MRFNRSLYTLFAGVVLGFFVAIGHDVLAEKQAPDSALPLEDLRTFTEVFSRIKRDYVEDVDDQTLLRSAIRGMLSGLDPHSAYLDPKEYKDLQAGTSGEFGGLGIEVGMENGFVKVIAPIDDTPASRAGIQAGDLIVRIDGKPVKGMSLSEAVSLMRGKPGTDIDLTLVRDGADQPIEVTITRAVIEVKSVKSRMLEPGFGYVRITNFQSNTGPAARQAIDALKAQSGGDLKGLVLDLRNNPGGVLNAAVEVSDAFLADGRIVYTEGRIDRAEMSFSATPDDVISDAPLVVLVNGGSASASEIVAGALQDHKRAVIMGSQTFGKGSVQTILPLQGGAAVKLTTARYFTPDGRSIQAEGIAPDVELQRLELTAAQDSAMDRVKEADLERHLSNGQSGGEPADGEGTEGTGDDAPLAAEDYALSEALNLLKGLNILRARGQ